MNYSVNELINAHKSLLSTLNKIEKAILSLEEKQVLGGNYKSQITLSKNRVKALEISLALIEREIEEKLKEEN